MRWTQTRAAEPRSPRALALGARPSRSISGDGGELEGERGTDARVVLE